MPWFKTAEILREIGIMSTNIAKFSLINQGVKFTHD